MKIGFIGLGRMGSNMVLNLIEKKNKIVAYNRTFGPVKQMKRKGAIPAYSLEELVKKLPSSKTTPKVIWIMIKAGKPVDMVIAKLIPLLNKGDIIIDGGNSFYKDSIRRNRLLKKKGIHFLDCGTSGGMEGARNGACMMVGGNKKVFNKIESLFRDMCTKDGYGYMGNAGAGHLVKMVHNGIEYGMMSALAEGFLAIEKHKPKFNTDLKEVSKVYANGSIIAGKLSSWLWKSFKTKGYLDKISCTVPKGETEDEMKELEGLADMPVLHQARLMRVKSRTVKTKTGKTRKNICGKLIAAMRNQFGGHKVIKK
ncbi:decarboxylating 6-phosphogluconate dehydrogenase [Candidatus Woesearchaeota archaeon]|nr:decarboxylating 6-phosphogluconate dehydrogenase [Candidatus Woesearchaeota archaeon]